MVKRLLGFLIYSNIFIGICAAALTGQTYLLINSFSTPWPLIVLVFSATVLVYSFHRSKQITKASKSHRHLWHLQNSNAYYLVIAGAGTLLVFSLFYITPILSFSLLPFGVITIAYSYPVFLLEGKAIPLKKVPYLKVFLIAFTVSSVTVLVPFISVIELSLLGLKDVGLLFMERLFFILAITLPFDIRDLDQDMKEGVKTIPALIGIKNTVMLSAFFLLCHAILVTIHAFTGQVLSYVEWIALLFAVLISTIAVLGVLWKRSDWYYSSVIDGTMIIQSALILAANYVLFSQILKGLV